MGGENNIVKSTTKDQFYYLTGNFVCTFLITDFYVKIKLLKYILCNLYIASFLSNSGAAPAIHPHPPPPEVCQVWRGLPSLALLFVTGGRKCCQQCLRKIPADY